MKNTYSDNLQQSDATQKVKKPRKKPKALILIILLIPLIYLFIEMYSIYFQPYRTQTAVQVTLADTVTAQGLVVRRETPLEIYNGAGAIGYNVSDGLRVSAGAQVASVYADITQFNNSCTARILQSRIQNLQDAQSKGILANDDVDGILKNLYNDYYSVLDILSQNNYSNLSSQKENFIGTVNRFYIATGKITDYTITIDNLSAKLNIMQQNSNIIQNITSPVAGYFVAYTDGLENVYTPETVFNYSTSEIYSHYKDDKAVQTGAVGKVITDYKWYYVCVVKAIDAQRFINAETDTKVELNFVNSTASAVPAFIQSVSDADDNGDVKVVLRVEEVHADIVNLRYENAEISFKTISGIRISKSAVHVVDGEYGVFVKYGHLVNFKRITPIFENDEYILVPLNSNEERTGINEIKLFDEVITEGKDLYDGKLL